MMQFGCEGQAIGFIDLKPSDGMLELISFTSSAHRKVMFRRSKSLRRKSKRVPASPEVEMIKELPKKKAEELVPEEKIKEPGFNASGTIENATFGAGIFY